MVRLSVALAIGLVTGIVTMLVGYWIGQAKGRVLLKMAYDLADRTQKQGEELLRLLLEDDEQ